MMDYATKLVSNMSILATATTGITTTTATKKLPVVTPNNSSGGLTTAHTFAKLDTLSAIVKNTFIKVVKANLTDYTAQYSPATTPTSAVAGAPHEVTAITMQTTRQTQTFPTLMTGNKNRAPGIVVYPTVSPESIVIPIVSCIFGFPILALIVICCLRRRAKLARERDRRRNYDMQDHAVSLVRFSPIHRLNYRSSRAVSLRPERSLSQGFTSLELDTVVEERSDAEQTQTEVLNNAESPLESSSVKLSFTS